MRFKHAFHVFVDNFTTTYKLLIYRIIVGLITVGLASAVIIPSLNFISDTPQYAQLHDKIVEIFNSIVNINADTDNESLIESIKAIIIGIQTAFGKLSEFLDMLSGKVALIAVAAVSLLAVRFINRFLVGMGNHTAAALVNDRMCLHANSSFTGTFIKNLGKSSLYSIIYAPLALAYDFIGFSVLGALAFAVPGTVVPLLLKIFICSVAILVLYAVKFLLTCNWLPSLIQGRRNNRKAMAYSFDLRGKRAGGMLSTAVVMMLLVMALNVAALIFTFGAGLLITVPASSLMLLSLQFTGYFDLNGLKYFVDDYTVIGPKKETPVSREEFFKGEQN